MHQKIHGLKKNKVGKGRKEVDREGCVCCEWGAIEHNVLEKTSVRR